MTIRLAHIEMQYGSIAAAEKVATSILEEARREALHEPAIDALELRGDIARERQDSAAAIAAYRDTLAYIDEAGFLERKTDVVLKLISLLLEDDDLIAAEPLVGYLIDQEDTADALRIRARYSFQAGDVEQSVELMETLRALPANEWTDADETSLLAYRAALGER